MYASQTKRLCVRGAPSDEARVQHLSSTSSSSSSASASSEQPSGNIHLRKSPNLVNSANNNNINSNDSQTLLAVGQSVHNMTASANETATTTPPRETKKRQPATENNTSFDSAAADSDLRCNSSTINSIAPATIDNSSGISIGNTSCTNVKLEFNINHQDCHEVDALNNLNNLIDRLADEVTDDSNRIQQLLQIRNLVTTCNKKKFLVVNNPKFNKIINLIDDERLSNDVKTQLALLLCSIAKSGEQTVKSLNEFSVDDKIFHLIQNSHDEALNEACLRCMRSIMSWPRTSRTWLLYEDAQQYLGQQESIQLNNDKGQNAIENNLRSIINYAQNNKSFIVQECIADTFAATCLRSKDQNLLHRASAIPCILQLLESPSERVVMSALNWLAKICKKNHIVSQELVNATCPSGILVLDLLTIMMSKWQWQEKQFLAAQCFAYIYRALATDALKSDRRIVCNILPTLIEMVRKDKPTYIRIKAAETIGYLIECETRLQNSASICGHLIESLADMLEHEQGPAFVDLRSFPQNQNRYSRGITWLDVASQQSPIISDRKLCQTNSSRQIVRSWDSSSIDEINNETKRAAFSALAALASNLEPIRKRILTTCSVVQHLVKSLVDSDTDTLKSVLTCLLSLSRSVQQLRTSIADNSVYSALRNLLTTTSNEVLILVLAILCNISLDFSPGKQHFLDPKTIDTLCNLTRRSDPVLKLHSVWILMNMMYQLKDQNLKFQVLRSMGISHILNLLDKENDEIVLKTLGFLRNLLSQKPHIDAIMSSHGDLIMQGLMRILEKPLPPRIKEQCLCVLTNIADGTESQNFIMGNRVILGYLARTLSDEQAGDVRLAAICCIINLAHKKYDGSHERCDELRKFGIDEKLRAMLNTSDSILLDRVQTACNQFGLDEKYVS